MPQFAHLPPSTCPWVTMFRNRGKVTEEIIQKRDDISCYLTTSGHCIVSVELFSNISSPVMECGLDIPEVHVVLIIKPFGRLHDIIQAFGRAGRLSSEGLKKALCYTLWEGEYKMDYVIILPFRTINNI